MGTLVRPSEYCGPVRKKSYHYVPGIIGMAYNSFINDDIRDCYLIMSSWCYLDSGCPEYRQLRRVRVKNDSLGI